MSLTESYQKPYQFAFSVNSFKELLNSTLSNLLTRFSVSLLIILVGFIIGKLLGKILERILSELELNKIIKKVSGVAINLEKISSSFISYFIFFMSIIMALNQLGITTDVLNIFSAAVLGLIVLSIFLGIKDFVPNFIAGLHISRKGILKEGDYIRFKNIEGRITEISLTEVIVETKSGDKIYIPNMNFMRYEVIKIKTFREKVSSLAKKVGKVFENKDQKKNKTESENINVKE